MINTNGEYATQVDLMAKYSKNTILQLTDRDNDGSFDMATLVRVWGEVDGEISAHLATAGYKKNSNTEIPAILKSIAVDLAFVALHTATIGEVADARAKLAREMLLKIATGKMKLELPSNSTNLNIKSIQARAKASPKSIVDNI